MTELTKISSKGQIVIPQKIREALQINEGSIIAIDIDSDVILLKKIDIDLVNQFKRSLEDVKNRKIRRIA